MDLLQTLGAGTATSDTVAIATSITFNCQYPDDKIFDPFVSKSIDKAILVDKASPLPADDKKESAKAQKGVILESLRGINVRDLKID